MLSIKFTLEKEIRRIDTGAKGKISFSELQTTCERLFRGKLSIYTLKYFDGEDWITCSSDEELQHALQLASNLESKILKFRVIPVNKRNILDSLEEAWKTFLAKNPAKQLWELIKKEEAERKARKAKSDAEKANPTPAIEPEQVQENDVKEQDIFEPLTASSSFEEKPASELETSVETEIAKNIEFLNDVQSDSDSSEKDEAPSTFEWQSAFPVEASQTSQTNSISIPPQEEEEEEVPAPVEEVSSQSRSVPDLSQSQLDPEKLALKLIQLEEMGFSNREKNATCLLKFNGDMMEAVKCLLEDV